MQELGGEATLVFDLLCVHPFRDGNGRVSRLATTLLLQAHGFEVGGSVGSRQPLRRAQVVLLIGCEGEQPCPTGRVRLCSTHAIPRPHPAGAGRASGADGCR